MRTVVLDNEAVQLTSDPRDITRVALPKAISVVRI